MAKNVLVLKNFETPKEAGTYYRLISLTGSNKGEAYVLLGNRVIIGRGDKVDIKINDGKASREHAEITHTGDKWFVTDLGSQNGIQINERKVTQSALQEGDKLIVGQTVFKFAKVEVGGKRVIRERADDQEKSNKKNLIPMVAMAAIVLMIFLSEDEKPIKFATKARKSVADLNVEYEANVKKKTLKEDKAVKEKLNVIYQRGLREYREGNYFRAIHEFNLALIIAPGDAQAEFYLRKTKEDLDRAIDGFVSRAQRDEESLKYQSAIVAYCSIIRLLYSVPEDTRYKNAEKKIKDLEAKLGLDVGETDCLKKQRKA